MPPRYPSHRRRICSTLGFLSRRTWTDLSDGMTHRLELNEESITDYLLLELQRRHPGVTTVKFTKIQESHRSGADWQWWFGSNGRWFGMRVQAKRLNTRRMRYDHLGYRTSPKHPRQIDRLIGDALANGLAPLYCFYNRVLHTPGWPCDCCNPFHEHLGCTIADARHVDLLLSQNATGFDDISLVSTPLMCLVCGGGTNRRALPDRARDAIGQLARYARDRVADIGRPEDSAWDDFDLPEVQDELPESVQLLLEPQGTLRPGDELEEETADNTNLDGILLIEEPEDHLRELRDLMKEIRDSGGR